MCAKGPAIRSAASLYKIEGIMSLPIDFDDFTWRSRLSTVHGDITGDQELSELEGEQVVWLEKYFVAVVWGMKTDENSVFIFSIAS